MSITEVTKSEYKTKMIVELSKFVDVYNQFSENKISIEVLDEEYDIFIRILGNYIYKIFTSETWLETKMFIDDAVLFDFSVFKGTEYTERVHSFLLSIKDAFYTSIDVDLYEYLETTNEFTDDEKVVCKSFYKTIKDLNQAMKHESFVSTTSNLADRNTISCFSDELKRFNDYMTVIQRDDTLKNTINKFDVVFKRISSSKKHMDIKF